jgi:hypothetical protein
VIVLEIGSLFNGMTDPAHLGHPSSEFEARLTGGDIVGDVTMAAERRIFLLLHQGLGMGSLQIALILLGMTFLTFLVIVEKDGNSAKKRWVRMLHSLFLKVCMALRTGKAAMGRGQEPSHIDPPRSLRKALF